MRVLGWLYFALLELVAAAFMVIGWVLLIPLCSSKRWWRYDAQSMHAHFPRLFWLWDNDEDGITPAWYNPQATLWRAYVWTAWRNSVNNLRFLVSWKGGPWWHWSNGKWYAQAGFRPDTGWPVLSAGAGLGTQIK